MKKIGLIIGCIAINYTVAAQNVGIGTTTPTAKLHIKGTADSTQLLIVANSTQSNTKPLIRLRKSDGSDLMWIHSDDESNVFVGLNAGRVNNAAGLGLNNTFIGSRAGLFNSTGSGNTATGWKAAGNNTTAYGNTAIGATSLYSNATASKNIAIGTSALYFQSYDPGFPWISGNVAVGYEALYWNQPTSQTNGINNTAIGTGTMYSNITGKNNTAIGNNALYLNYQGSSNTANGFQALYSNTTGNNNIAIGEQALYSNTIGGSNIASGYQALAYNSTASHNVAIGTYALLSQSYSNGGALWSSGNVAIGYATLEFNDPTSVLDGINNTAIGNSALTTNLNGAYNTGIGANALYSNTNGFYNTAVGSRALYSNTVGYFNTAIGTQALHFNNTGNGNTAVGQEALSNNGTGADNTANGYLSLYNNNAGYENTAIGHVALFSNTTAFLNTAVGSNALGNTTTGAYNTALGANALTNNVGGYQNIAIGYGSGTHFTAPNIFNTISIGNDGILNAFQNQAFLGNLSTLWNGGNKTWSTYSDARMKKNITEDVKGLEFITRLKPVTYYRDINAAIKITDNKNTPDFPGKYDVEKIKETGFLAQDVERAARESNYDFSGITVPKNSKELYTLSYEVFVVPLVKAVQELSEQTIAQKKIIEQQQLQYEALLKRVEALEKKN